MTAIELICFGALVLVVIVLTFFLGKSLGRAQAVRLEIHPGEKHREEQAKEDAKALNERVLKLTANVRVHLDDSTTFSDLVDFGDDDEDDHCTGEMQEDDGSPN